MVSACTGFTVVLLRASRLVSLSNKHILTTILLKLTIIYKLLIYTTQNMFTAVKRWKIVKAKQSTSKIRLSYSQFKV